MGDYKKQLENISKLYINSKTNYDFKLSDYGRGIDDSTISEDYSTHSKFIRQCMIVAGVFVILFITIQYIALFYLINKYLSQVNQYSAIVLTSFVAATFGETIIIAKVMANSVFANDHQNRLASYKSNESDIAETTI